MGAIGQVVKADITLRVVKIGAAVVGLAVALKGLHIIAGKRKAKRTTDDG
jgi:hypothetical protein